MATNAIDGVDMRPRAAARAARRALDGALTSARPDAVRDDRRYVTTVEDNLLPGIERTEIEAAFQAGAGNELEGKMRAPWSSSALVVNTFARWAADASLLQVAGSSGFCRGLSFEAKCPNGVSRIPPHLDILLEQAEGLVAIESKCTEYLAVKVAKVAPAYLQLAAAARSSSWLGAFREASNFRVLDAYQLAKHWLGLTSCYPGRLLTLVYLYWEPTNASAFPIFALHREEVERFAEAVRDDRTCRFVPLSYAEHWNELGAMPGKPAWLDEHLLALRRRYEVGI